MSTALVIAATALVAPLTAPPADLLTVAESSDYRATATHGQVMDLLGRIAERSDRVHLTEFGRSEEDKPLPLAIIADPPVANPAAARASGKTIVLAFGDIHAGEVCGKEAILMLVRELALADDAPLLDSLVVLAAPIYNADGNDRIGPDNRPGQVGPADGMGERTNAGGLDLNRDWMKLESVEAQAMVRLLSEWDPHLTIDTHTTNGSRHRYVLTYAAPNNPSGYEPSIAFVRDRLLPVVTERLLERTGHDTFFYGNFDREHSIWATYSAQPRFGCPYRGLRGQMSILSEAYAYASYEDRVLATLEFLREILTFAAERPARLQALHDAAKRDTTQRGRNPQPDDVIGIRHRLAARRRPAVVRGFETGGGADGTPSDEPRDHTVVHLGRFEPTLSVRRPYAYVIGPDLPGVVAKLAQHGIRTEPFAGDAVVEAYTVRDVSRARRPFQGHRAVTLEVDAKVATHAFAPGSVLVPTAQPLGTLAVYLLEPRSEDGLATWNFLDDAIEPGATFPIYRVRAGADIRR